MLPLYHIIFSLVFIPLIFVEKLFILSLISSILIDLDHFQYIAHVLKTKKISPKNFTSKKRKPNVCIFHTPYFLLILLILSSLLYGTSIANINIGKVLLFILIGLIFHIITDLTYLIISHIKKKEERNKEIFLTKFIGLPHRNK